MDLQLSKTVPIITLRLLEPILNIFEFQWKLRFFQKNRDFCWFKKNTKLCRGLKNDLDVVAIRLTRRWKAHDFVFPFLNFLSNFRSFCNLNGILKSHSKFPWILHVYRYGPKKVSKMRNLLMQSIFSESMDRQLSKTVPIITLRLLEPILCQFEVR